MPICSVYGSRSACTGADWPVRAPAVADATPLCIALERYLLLGAYRPGQAEADIPNGLTLLGCLHLVVANQWSEVRLRARLDLRRRNAAL
jgi:hypothetical protein